MTTHPYGFAPDEPVPYAFNRPFQVVVVDFGMFVELPQRLREGLREFAIGLGTRDARRVLDSYAKVGVLQPGGDLYRLEEMIQTQLDDLWGTFLGQMRTGDLDSEVAKAFFEKYEELLSVTPLQFQTEMLFVVRAMWILSGVTSHLEPEFDPWTETATFAQALIQEDILTGVQSVLQDLLAGRLPLMLGPLLRRWSQSSSTAPIVPVLDPRAEDIRILRRRVNRLISAVVACGMLGVGALLKSRGVRVADAFALLWPGSDLGQWIIEISAVALILVLLRGGSHD
jgi:predicted unusual protein kinase regulating ubiquinone biosynthesis (AarF/ABC1/UbiB family)